jgi:hypothetical protein
MKNIVLAVLAVFVTWSVVIFVEHGIILAAAYSASPQLWRPQAEIKMGLTYITVLIKAVVFVCIYAWWISEKGTRTAILYSLLFGIGAGVSMGYGSYAVMPMPYSMAFTWFGGIVVETVVAGGIMGVVLKDRR